MFRSIHRSVLLFGVGHGRTGDHTRIRVQRSLDRRFQLSYPQHQLGIFYRDCTLTHRLLNCLRALHHAEIVSVTTPVYHRVSEDVLVFGVLLFHHSKVLKIFTKLTDQPSFAGTWIENYLDGFIQMLR